MFFNGENVGLRKAVYDTNQNLYLGLVVLSGENEGELLMDVTVNGKTLPLDHAAVNIHENEDMDIFIKSYKLGSPTGETEKIGFWEYPIYRFNIEEIDKNLAKGV